MFVTRLAGDCSLVLQVQHVAGPPGGAVQRGTDAHEHGVALPQNASVGLGDGEPDGRCPPERVNVAQPAETVFQVGFEQVGDLAGGAMALFHSPVQFCEPRPALSAQVRSNLGDDSLAELLVTGHHPRGHQRRRRVEVVADQ